MDYLTLPDRIASKIEPCPTTGCWLWTAYIGPNGYGYINYKRTPTLAHRLVKSMLVGPLTDGLECDHTCRNRACVNPLHIEEVTSAENTRRGDAWKFNGLKTHCPGGHPFEGSNLYVYPNGRRGCVTCISEHGKRRYAANPEPYKRRAREQRERRKALRHAA